MLVAFEDDEPFSPEMVATAIKLSRKRRRGVHIHSMITVPNHLPLDAEMPEYDSAAQSKIEQAKLIGGRGSPGTWSASARGRRATRSRTRRR